MLSSLRGLLSCLCLEDSAAVKFVFAKPVKQRWGDSSQHHCTSGCSQRLHCRPPLGPLAVEESVAPRWFCLSVFSFFPFSFPALSSIYAAACLLPPYLPLIRCVLKVIMCSESKWGHLVLPRLFLWAEDIWLSLERRPNKKKQQHKKVAWIVFGISLDAESIPNWKDRRGNHFTAYMLSSWAACTAKQTSSLQFPRSSGATNA